MSLFNQTRGLNIINTTNETISFFNESDELIRSYEPNDCCITVEQSFYEVGERGFLSSVIRLTNDTGIPLVQKEETSMKIPNKINDGDVFIMTYERYLEICLYAREGNLIKTSLRIGYPKDQVYDEEGNVKGYKSIVVEQIISNVL